MPKKSDYENVRGSGGSRTLIRKNSKYGKDYDTYTDGGKSFGSFAAYQLGEKAKKKAKEQKSSTKKEKWDP